MDYSIFMLGHRVEDEAAVSELVGGPAARFYTLAHRKRQLFRPTGTPPPPCRRIGSGPRGLETVGKLQRPGTTSSTILPRSDTQHAGKAPRETISPLVLIGGRGRARLDTVIQHALRGSTTLASRLVVSLRLLTTALTISSRFEMP